MSSRENKPSESWCRDRKLQVAAGVALGAMVSLGLCCYQWVQLGSELKQVRQLSEERREYVVKFEALEKEQAEREKENVLLGERVAELEAGKKALVDLIGENKRGVQKKEEMVRAVIDSLQEVYAIKYESNNPELRELENRLGRSAEVRKQWESICDVLEKNGEYGKEASLLRLRIAQSSMAAGEWGKMDVSKVDWKAAGLEQKRALILTRLHYGAALGQLEAGKREMAEASLKECLEYAAEIPDGTESKDYALAMGNMLQAKLQISEKPAESLKHSIAAIGHLRKVVVDMPDNIPLRCTFTQACMDGALMTAGGESAGWSEKLRKEAHGHAYWLVRKHPELELGHRLCAENDVLIAEQRLREGEKNVVEPLLKRAEGSLEKCGGDPVLEAAIKGLRAFMMWDKGDRSGSNSLMSQAIDSMRGYISKNPKDIEARYRLSSLLWERSAMRLDKVEAIEDGRAAAVVLVELVREGAGRRETAARRMIAIIFGDIGHMAAEAGQTERAKQYFKSALEQWTYLAEKWGECDEYREGKRWCSSRLGSL